MPTLHDLFKTYKDRANANNDPYVIAVIWGPFLEMLEGVINSATRTKYPNWGQEQDFKVEFPHDWTTPMLQANKITSANKRRNNKIEQNHSSIREMFGYRNNQAHFNRQRDYSKHNLGILGKQIGLFIDGLQELGNGSLYDIITRHLDSEWKLTTFDATPSSVGGFFLSVLLRHSPNRNNEKDLVWRKDCLVSAVDRLASNFARPKIKRLR